MPCYTRKIPCSISSITGLSSSMTAEGGSSWWIEGDFDGDFDASGPNEGDILGSQRSHGTIFRGVIRNARPLGPIDPALEPKTPPIRQSFIPEVHGTIASPGGELRTCRFAMADAQISGWTLHSNRDGDPSAGPLLGRVRGTIRGRLVAIPESDTTTAPEPADLRPEGDTPHSSNRKTEPNAPTTPEDAEPHQVLARGKVVAGCPVCRFAFGLFTALVVTGIGLLDGDWILTVWTTSMLVVPWVLSCLIQQLAPHGTTRRSQHQLGLILLLLIGLLWWLQVRFSLTVICIGLFALPSYLIALIVIVTGRSACWSHGLGLLAWTVYLLSSSGLGLNECASRGLNRQLNNEVAELIAQPGSEDSQPDGTSEKSALDERQAPAESSVDSQRDGKSQVRESADAAWPTLLDQLRERVKSKIERIPRWIEEKADLLAEKVEQDQNTLPDGLTRITLEKALTSPERYFSCRGADGTALSRARYTVYLGEGAVFGFNSASLEPSADARLHKLGQLLQASSKKEIVISGHADRSGVVENNEALSLERSKSVADWLTRAGYLEPRNVQVIGEGDRLPIVSTDDPEPLNRRVEVKVDCEKRKP